MNSSENYQLLLKSYQLKDILSSNGIELNTEECQVLLKEGFCQNISRKIRKELSKNPACAGNKLLEITLLSITHRFLLSELDRMERSLREKENFSVGDLIRGANTGLYIIEYLSSVLLLSEKLKKEEFKKFSSDQYSYHPYDLLREKDKNILLKNLKDELMPLSSSGNVEEMLFTGSLFKKEIGEELNLLSKLGPKTIKDINKLSAWSQNLSELIDECAVFVTVPEGLKEFGDLMKNFIMLKSREKEKDILPLMEKEASNIIHKLAYPLKYIIRYWNREMLDERKISHILFERFLFGLKLLYISIKQFRFALDNYSIIHLMTGLELVSSAEEQFLLMIDKRKTNINNEGKDLLENFLLKHSPGEIKKDTIINRLEDELNDLYLEYELKISYNDIENLRGDFLKRTIRDYKKNLEKLEDCKDKDLFLSEVIPGILYGNNRLCLYKNYGWSSNYESCPLNYRKL